MDSALFDSAIPMQIGNQQYMASMFTDKDYGDLDNYIRSSFIQMGVEAAEKLKNGMADKLISITLTKATEVGWMTVEGINIISTVDGICQLGFQSIRKRHPEVKYSEFRAEFDSNRAKACQNINLADRQLNFVKKKEGSTDSGGSVTGNPKS